MPVSMTKAAINKLLIEERKKSREKQKQSLFMRRTLSIYKGQKVRMQEWCVAHNKMFKGLPYTLEVFRDFAEGALQKRCRYCEGKLTIRTFTPDHRKAIAAGGSWDMNNLVASCQKCNWEKGKMSGLEFIELLRFCDLYLSVESAADLKRRLSIGGKWSPK